MEITNKTLAMFLVAAIVVSLAGTIISLNKLGGISTTGYAASDTGTASLYVNSTTDIFFTIDAINWGEGYVNVSPGAPLYCTLDSEGNILAAGCVRFTANDVGLVLENDGNTYPTVRLAANQSGIDMFGDASAMLQYWVEDNETDSCASPLPIAYTDVNTTGLGTMICDGMEYLTGNDTLRINVLVNFTNLASTGSKSTTFTATAS